METRDNWRQHWNDFADAASTNPAQHMRHRIITTLLKKEAIREPQRFLDLGSGQGDLLFRLSRSFPQAAYLGIEQSESGVALARRKVASATFVIADVFAPPTTLVPYENWATYVTCSEVLEHVEDPVEFLKQAKKYFADNALCIVTVPGGDLSAFDRHIGHRRHFTRPELWQILEQAGMQVENIYRAGFPFFNLYRLAVIARGERLIDDARNAAPDIPRLLVRLIMRLFLFLFRFTLLDSPFGWQMIAVVRYQGGHPQ